MTISKQKILAAEQVTDQEALVKLLIPEGPKIIKRVIPGGKTLLKQIGASDMEAAIFNWLRGCRSFTEVKISWAKSPEEWHPTVVKVHSFDTRDPRPVWERKNDGKRSLAKDMAQYATKPFVFMHVKPDGIYIGEDRTGKFKPYMVLTEEHLKQPEYAGRIIGEKVSHPGWEPYIEYVAQGLGRYTNIQRKSEK